MHRLQRPDTHLRIYLRGFNATVAQHRLDPSEVRTVLQHLRRHRVPEQVAAALFYARRSQVRHHRHRDAAGRQPRQAVHRQEQRLTVGDAEHRRAHIMQITRQPPQRPLAQPIISAAITGCNPLPPLTTGN